MNNNNNKHPKAGTELGISYNGQLYIHPENKKYIESLSKPDSLKHIETKAVKGTAGFSKKRTIEAPKTEEEKKLDKRRELQERLALYQNTIARLSKELETNKRIEKSLIEDLNKLKEDGISKNKT